MNHQQIESVLPSFTGLKIIDSRILLTAHLKLKSGILNLHIVNLICSPWSPSQIKGFPVINIFSLYEI